MQQVNHALVRPWPLGVEAPFAMGLYAQFLGASQARGDYSACVSSAHKKRGTLRSPFASDLSISGLSQPGKLEQTL